MSPDKSKRNGVKAKVTAVNKKPLNNQNIILSSEEKSNSNSIQMQQTSKNFESDIHTGNQTG